MVRSQLGVSTPSGVLVQKTRPIILMACFKSLRSNVGNVTTIFVSHTEMAAQVGIRDKILRVSMPFDKGRNSMIISRAVLRQKSLVSEKATDRWSTVLTVGSWAAQLREGRVRSCAEIAGRGGITRVRAFQLWPLCKITREQADEARRASKASEISLRTLIRVARNPGLRSDHTGA
jgi:hypothetical protein